MLVWYADWSNKFWGIVRFSLVKREVRSLFNVEDTVEGEVVWLIYRGDVVTIVLFTIIFWGLV